MNPDRVSSPWRFATVALISAGIALLSTIPGLPEPGDSALVWAAASVPSLLQKSLHLVAYAALAISAAWLFNGLKWRSPHLLAFLYSAAFGAILEWAQLYVPGRFGSVFDIALNAIGAAAGLLALALFLKSAQ